MLRVLCVILVVALPRLLLAQSRSPEAIASFERQIRPLLVEQCVSCHGPKKQEAGLRLDSRASVFAKLDFGKAVAPGDLSASRLIQVIRHLDDDIQMPPEKKLPAESIAALEQWVTAGAAWPEEDSPMASTDPNAWKKHWAFQPIARPTPPPVADTDWPTNDVDRFILKKLEEAKLQPAERASPRTLVRRLYFDLTGLPPTVEVVAAFEQDPSEAAWASLVDELLASPHFGERWARHWMDIARYYDKTGYVFRQERKLGDAWKYRDWLIRSFNNDLPINEFLIHQIAVDQVLPADAGDQLAATGFLTLGRRFLNNKHDIIDDRIDVVTRGMMGFTVTCARCHDHKYDPIPAADYYSLYGVFASTHEPDREKTTVRLADLPKPFDPYVFLRGQQGNHGDRVPRQFLSALSPERKPFAQGSGRLELAQAIASDDNPLTARVFVNRAWGHLFGQHLADTPSDFGVRSEPPSHPLLLDHLAGSFIDEGWSFKQLIRRIVLSSAYRQSSNGEPHASDPENRLFARMNRKRLEFEAQRDALLAASGELDTTLGGPSVDITKAPYPKRRAVYAYIDRQNLPGVFRAFDLASPDTHSPKRFQTTVPQQGLFLLNNEFVLEQAVALADRTASIAEPNERVSQLFRQAYAREPSAAESAACLAYLQTAKASPSAVAAVPWDYGYGFYDASTDRVGSFTPYPTFATNAWRGSEKVPDPTIGWSLLNSVGGHPGDAQHAAIRRWIAPAAGRLVINGQLKHPSDKGNGVLGRVVSSRAGQIKEWSAKHQTTNTAVASFAVEQGETIDLICESAGDTSFDSFTWEVKLQLTTTERGVQTYDSQQQFQSNRPQALSAWSRLSHVLLLANEFVFVD